MPELQAAVWELSWCTCRCQIPPCHPQQSIPNGYFLFHRRALQNNQHPATQNPPGYPERAGLFHSLHIHSTAPPHYTQDTSTSPTLILTRNTHANDTTKQYSLLPQSEKHTNVAYS